MNTFKIASCAALLMMSGVVSAASFTVSNSFSYGGGLVDYATNGEVHLNSGTFNTNMDNDWFTDVFTVTNTGTSDAKISVLGGNASYGGNITDFHAFYATSGDLASSIALPYTWVVDAFSVVLAAGDSAMLTIEGTFNSDSSYDLTLNSVETPLPAAVWLFGSALMGLAGASRRKKTAIAA